MGKGMKNAEKLSSPNKGKASPPSSPALSALDSFNQIHGKNFSTTTRQGIGMMWRFLADAEKFQWMVFVERR